MTSVAAAMVNIPKEYDRWLRLWMLIDYGGTKLCHDILFNQKKRPTDGVGFQNALCHLKKENLTHKDQRDKVFPTNAEPDINTFDVTLLAVIIEHEFRNEYNGLLRDVRYWRNKIVHEGKKLLSQDEFDQRWRKISGMLKRHSFNCNSDNLKSIRDLKTYDIILHEEYRHIIVFILQGRIILLL